MKRIPLKDLQNLTISPDRAEGKSWEEMCTTFEQSLKNETLLDSVRIFVPNELALSLAEAVKKDIDRNYEMLRVRISILLDFDPEKVREVFDRKRSLPELEMIAQAIADGVDYRQFVNEEE